jgi:DNA-directed RNA polymerase specialized sigma24 family protein
LKTIAASVVIDYFRSGATQKKGSGKVATSLDEIAPRLATNDPRFADVERRMLLEQVEKCLVPEEPRNRRIFWLYHRQGLTPRTISEMPGIGMATGGVETAIYRLTRMVRECLKRAGMLQSMIVPEGGRA